MVEVTVLPKLISKFAEACTQSQGKINKVALFHALHFTAFFVTWVCHMLIPNLYLVSEMS